MRKNELQISYIELKENALKLNIPEGERLELCYGIDYQIDSKGNVILNSYKVNKGNFIFIIETKINDKSIIQQKYGLKLIESDNCRFNILDFDYYNKSYDVFVIIQQ